MEDLNKNQIVLLTLLVSFVTSIATGIITTSLLQVAPVEVTRNINSIVEKTIQTAAPVNALVSTPSSQNNSGQGVTTTTIVVNEDDAVTQSINKNVQSVVRLSEYNPLAQTSDLYGIGVLITKDGVIATDRKTITPGYTYSGVLNDGTHITVTPMAVDKNTNFILFKASLPDGKTSYTFVPATLARQEPQLGQTVIGIGGDTTNATAIGRVISLQTKDATVGTTTTKYLAGINTDVSSKDLVDGAPLLNLSGEVIGMQLEGSTGNSFTPISILQAELPALQASSPKVQ